MHVLNMDAQVSMVSDLISGFRGINPLPVGSGTWQQALENIKSGKYQQAIEAVRELVKKHGAGSDQYKKQKCRLPAITFGGGFSKGRKNSHLEHPTGFLIPDIDSIPQQAESLFNLLIQDTNIWFVFRSPSGEGLKVGIRGQNIADDKDHKKFYFSVERYFKELYGVKIDTACKDISRLTFVSHDPALWINTDPQFFDIQKWKPEESPPPKQPVWLPSGEAKGKEKYARKVLEGCCQRISESPSGEKHHTRLKESRLIGGYLQWLSEGDILIAFEQAITTSGTPNVVHAMKTVQNGIEYGKMSPLAIEDYKNTHDNRYDDQRKVNASDDISDPEGPTVPNRPQQTPTDPMRPHIDPTLTPNSPQQTPLDPTFSTVGTQNLSNDIVEFLRNTKGSFTIEFLDRELGLTTRNQKHRRAKIIRKILKKDLKNKTEILLKKDRSKANLYYVPSTEMDWIDIEAPTEESFPLKLPFDLDQKISIPPKSIIVIAGSFNAGKTALILNTLRLNLESSFEKLFLVSEGTGEIKGRIKSFGDPLSLWKDNVMIASQCDDFDTAIENYNTKGLTCIDYLEPPEGQYYLLTSQIRNIYDCLDTGVAMIAIQKRSDHAMGRGGEGTAEKARLYMTVDYLCTCKRSIVCALALTKVKQSLDESMQGKELHFRIERGSSLTPLTDWMLSSRVNREKCAREYENEDAQKSYKKVEDGDYIFRTNNGKNEIKMVRITKKQAEEWAKNMPNINVFEKLERMAVDSMEKLFLNKGYLWQIVGTLDKAQARASQQTIGEEMPAGESG